jgi:phenol 2-monooxygenase (NADPH)
MPMYGRASTLLPRSLELLDSYDLLHEMVQSGFIHRGAVAYRQGKRVTSRGWQGMWSAHGTFCDFALNLRLKYSEEIFQNAYEKNGGIVATGWEVADIKIDAGAGDENKVETLIRKRETGEIRNIRRYASHPTPFPRSCLIRS